MAGFVHGSAADIEIQDAAAAYVLFSQYVASAGLARSFDTAETTNLASSAKEYIAGLADGTISISGFFDSVADGKLVGIVGMIRGFKFYPEGKSTGKAMKSGSCLITSLESEASTDAAVSLDAEFQVTGAITDGTAP